MKTLSAGYRPEIEGLRAVAVVPVVLFHFGVAGVAGGFVGVDIFFVISGFLIGGILWAEFTRSGTIRLGHFFYRRIRRLAPAYAVSKGAGRILTRALVADLGDRFPDIVIGDWIPGALNTGMGLPEGIEPARAARWGANLALWTDRTLNGTIFSENREHLPAPSFKRRLFNRLTGQGARARLLD